MRKEKARNPDVIRSINSESETLPPRTYVPATIPSSEFETAFQPTRSRVVEAAGGSEPRILLLSEMGSCL